MANEQEKMNEAEFFLEHMRLAGEDVPKFKKYLSAFLNSSRSVLYFAAGETSKSPEGKEWYQEITKRFPIISYLRDKRDEDVHRVPVTVAKDVTVHIHGVARIVARVSAVIIRKDGSVERHPELESPEQEPIREIPATSSYKYRFHDWTGDEDVPTLCAKYLSTLRELIKEGREKGYLK